MLLLRGGGGKGQPGSQDIPTIKQAGSNLVRAGREAGVGLALFPSLCIGIGVTEFSGMA